jgi:hypothetical protein
VKKHISPLFLLIILTAFLLISTQPIQANPLLELIVKTDKTKYYAKDFVQVYGNLTLDGTPVTDALVGIQIQNQQDNLVTIRTLTTGNPPPTTPYIFLEYVVPCDQNGNPKYSFYNGTLSYYKISIVNFDIETRIVLMTINTYYGDNTPFGFAAINATIAAKSSPKYIISIPIPNDATLGTAAVYANAYTDWPKTGGTPYCMEVNSTFEIISTSGGGLSQSQTTQHPTTLENSENETANFNLTFKLPRKTPYGNCTVYVTSMYLSETASNTTKFEVYILGDLGSGPPPTFFAYDGKVNAYDLALFIQCYKGLAPPEAMYLGDLGSGPPPTFFAYDGKVNAYDLALFIQCYKGLGP